MYVDFFKCDKIKKTTNTSKFLRHSGIDCGTKTLFRVVRLTFTNVTRKKEVMPDRCLVLHSHARATLHSIVLQFTATLYILVPLMFLVQQALDVRFYYILNH